MMFAYITIQIGTVCRELHTDTFPPWVFSSLKDLFQNVILYENSNNQLIMKCPFAWLYKE
jgi:hypothetical protein